MEEIQKILIMLCQEYDSLGWLSLEKWGLGRAIELVLNKIRLHRFSSAEKADAFVEAMAKFERQVHHPFLTRRLNDVKLHVYRHGYQSTN